jgi:hypothetical protein
VRPSTNCLELNDGSRMAAAPSGRPLVAEAKEAAQLLWPEVSALAASRRNPADLDRLEAAQLATDEDLRAALLAAALNRFLSHIVSRLDDGRSDVSLRSVDLDASTGGHSTARPRPAPRRDARVDRRRRTGSPSWHFANEPTVCISPSLRRSLRVSPLTRAC